jgi:hypothetical protein
MLPESVSKKRTVHKSAVNWLRTTFVLEKREGLGNAVLQVATAVLLSISADGLTSILSIIGHSEEETHPYRETL